MPSTAAARARQTKIEELLEVIEELLEVIEELLEVLDSRRR